MAQEEDFAQEVDLSRRLGRAHEALAMIAQRPRDRRLHLSLRHAAFMLPSDIVNLCLVLELAQTMGFPGIQLDPPAPGFLGVFLWSIGFYDLFPEHAPRVPQAFLPLLAKEKGIELTRFTDTAGAWKLRERLPDVLGATPGAMDIPDATQCFRRLAITAYELAENAIVHSRRLTHGAVVGYYMVQRIPRRRQTFVAVGDAGDGIPATMRERYPQLSDDLQALRLALQPGVSGHGGGGNGLALACKAAHEIPGGVMTVESGGAWLRSRRDGGEEHQSYPGAERITRVSFKFDL
jgi:hypothetical protein